MTVDPWTLAEARQGKREALARLLAMYYPQVWRMAVNLTGRDALYLSSRTDWVVPVAAVLLTAAAIGRLVTSRTSTPEPLRENLRLLRKTGLQVVTLPMPRPVWFDGQRLPASYANFYIANRTVLAPTFNDANDRIALNTLAKLFPDREVIGIHCVDLVLGLGTLHCMTQQQPE